VHSPPQGQEGPKRATTKKEEFLFLSFLSFLGILGKDVDTRRRMHNTSNENRDTMIILPNIIYFTKQNSENQVFIFKNIFGDVKKCMFCA